MKNVTLVCIDTKNKYESLYTLDKMSRIFNFKDVLFFSNGVNSKSIKVIDIPDIVGKKAGWSYSHFCLKELPKYIETEFCLVVQHDGFIINPDKWTSEFTDYDYIGAPWVDDYPNRVGNGGFSLRSKKFLDACADIYKNVEINEHEDLLACVYGYNLFRERGVRFAPVKLAAQFSIEHPVPEMEHTRPFGFHGIFTNFTKKAIHEHYNNFTL